MAFGRERAIHAALAAGGLRTRVVEEAAKLAGLRGLLPTQAGGDDGGETYSLVSGTVGGFAVKVGGHGFSQWGEINSRSLSLLAFPCPLPAFAYPP